MLSVLAPTAFFVSRVLGLETRFAPPRPRVLRLLAIHVPDGATREMPRAPGAMTIRCCSGSAWITQDGDPRDVVLQPNQIHAVDREQRLTVHAMDGDCRLELRVESDR